jgi:hypothetical protein
MSRAKQPGTIHHAFSAFVVAESSIFLFIVEAQASFQKAARQNPFFVCFAQRSIEPIPFVETRRRHVSPVLV